MQDSRCQKSPAPLSVLALWRQFLPLSVSDVTMALCDPLITASLARLPLALASMAALGVVKAIAVVFESPIIMLLHASNALAVSQASRRLMKRFTLVAALLLTLGMLGLALPAVFFRCVQGVMGVEADIALLAHRGFLYLLLWPAIIAWRRYHQGLLIFDGQGRAIARAGLVRLFVVLGVLASGLKLNLAGIDLAGLALLSGIASETLVVTWAARPRGAYQPEAAPVVASLPRNLRQVLGFYWPLANTMLLVWGGRALLLALIARAHDGPLALAAWPAAWGLTLVLANATRMVQQVVIRNREQAPLRVLLEFATSVGLVFALLLIAVATTPLGQNVITVFVAGNKALGLSMGPVLSLCAGVPLLVSWQNALQGLLIAVARTRQVNLATWVGTLVLLGSGLVLLQTGLGGATAAALATLASLLAETSLLIYAYNRASGLRLASFLKA